MRSSILLGAFFAVLVLAAPAFADAAAEKEARALFTQGNQRFDADDDVGALELYRAAYAKWPNPKILWNIGTTLRRLGRHAEAADAYEAYLGDPGGDPAKKDEGKKLLAELEPRVTRLSVSVDDPAAKVRVDGRIVGQNGGASLRVDAGPHTVLAEKEGAAPAVANITAVAGTEQRVALHVLDAGAVPAPARPPVSPAVPVAEPPRDAKATGRAMSGQRVASVVVGAAGIAGVGVGAVLGGLAMAKNNASKADGHCDANSFCDATGTALRLDAIHMATGSTVGIVAGGVALAGGVVLFVTAPTKRPDMVGLAIGPASVSLSGRW